MRESRAGPAATMPLTTARFAAEVAEVVPVVVGEVDVAVGALVDPVVEVDSVILVPFSRMALR